MPTRNFDGVNDYLSLNDAVPPVGDEPMTILCRYLQGTTANNGVGVVSIHDYGGKSDKHFEMYIDNTEFPVPKAPSNIMFAGRRLGATTAFASARVTGVTTSDWMAAAVVFVGNADRKAYLMKIGDLGSFASGSNTTEVTGSVEGSGTDIWLGSKAGQFSNGFFNGDIAEFHLLDVAIDERDFKAFGMGRDIQDVAPQSWVSILRLRTPAGTSERMHRRQGVAPPLFALHGQPAVNDVSVPATWLPQEGVLIG